MAKRKSKAARKVQAENYRHPTADSPLRPDVGTQAQFRKKKPPVSYRYDSSLSPALDWDGQNAAREEGEALIRQILEADTLEAAQGAAARLKALSGPFLNWAGKAERLSFDVPTLPLFVHERLATKAIIETLKGHRKSPEQLELFSDPQHPIADQVLRAYEHRDRWVNRMILGDSLVVMNSLLQYEGLGGQVQMIYMDPPYGIKFGSNFQPFVRKRDVKHNEDKDMTREPEMVQAYRDTWELGLHSYLTYMRDRLLVARELLAPTGSIFVQISDENVHHVRELMDEVFGPENFQAQINFKATSALGQKGLRQAYDYMIWYSRDKDKAVAKFRPLFVLRDIVEDREWRLIDDPGTDQGYRKLSDEEFRTLTGYAGVFRRAKMTSSGWTPSCTFTFDFQGVQCRPYGRKSWLTNQEGMQALIEKKRLFLLGNSPYFKQYYNDFPVVNIDNSWRDQPAAEERAYVVQTADKFIQRCMLMTTDPGDLVLDPTCGSGTTAYVAEQWGRRWITIDVSRVPSALARQRLLTATFPWYELSDESRGPAGGFVYKPEDESKNPKSVGPGIVPHITLKSIANNEPPGEEVLVDRPEVIGNITRVSGPFTVEATIPTPVDWEGDGVEDSTPAIAEAHGSFVERMLEVLRKSPVLRLAGNRMVTLKNVRPPAKTLSLSAEAMVKPSELGPPKSPEDMKEHALDDMGGRLPFSDKPVAIVFGPENGAVSESLVYQAAREAHAKDYAHLYVIGFAIQPKALELVENCEQVVGVPATYVQATPDLMMGDLLKNMRSSQIFSVCGLPDVKLTKTKDKDGVTKYQVELLGLDVFDPATTDLDHRNGNDVPAWFLDTDYNDLCFHVCQAFFPRTSAWDNLKRALRGLYEESVWDHLAGAVSAPFEAGEHGQVAVKVIDDRGNELPWVKNLKEAKG